jgi:hypothetical protein
MSSPQFVRIQPGALQQELSDIHMVHAACMMFRMRCLSHRILEYGWESSLNHLSFVEAICLAVLLPIHMHDELVRAAYPKADERWKAFLRGQVPHLCQEAVPV